MVQVFFHDIKEIPDWIKVLKPIEKKKWSVEEAQELLNNGYSMQETSNLLNITQSGIYRAMKNDELYLPDNYQIHRQKNNKHLKTILRYSLLGNFLNKYESAQEIVEFDIHGVRYACLGKYTKNPHEYMGYLWFYEGDDIIIENNNLTNRTYKTVVKLDLNYNLLGEFEKVDLNNIPNYDYETILRHCRGEISKKVKYTSEYQLHKYKDYLWYYKDDYESKINNVEFLNTVYDKYKI
jgi:predicted transcriptional regulator